MLMWMATRGRVPHAITHTVVQEDIYGLVKIRHDFITTIEWTFMSTQRGAKVMNNLVDFFVYLACEQECIGHSRHNLVHFSNSVIVSYTIWY